MDMSRNMYTKVGVHLEQLRCMYKYDQGKLQQVLKLQ